MKGDIDNEWIMVTHQRCPPTRSPLRHPDDENGGGYGIWKSPQYVSDDLAPWNAWAMSIEMQHHLREIDRLFEGIDG